MKYARKKTVETCKTKGSKSWFNDNVKTDYNSSVLKTTYKSIANVKINKTFN